MTKKEKSQIDWSDDKPQSWSISPLKALGTFFKGSQVNKEDLVENGTTFISYGLAHSKENPQYVFNESLARYVRQEDANRLRTSSLKQGDLIFATTSEDVEGLGNCIYYDKAQPAVAGGDTIVFRNTSNRLLPQYLAFLAMSDAWRSQVRGTMGVKVLHLPIQTLKNSVCLVPSLEEQKVIIQQLKAIAQDTAHQTEIIEEQIEMLELYKKSLIHETVTKGLDPNAPLKPSGVEWIGDIPEHWNAKKLKYVLDNLDNLRAPVEASQRNQDGDVLYKYYGASGAIDYIDDFNVSGTSILIGEDGANLISRNLPLAYWAEGKYWVNNHAHILRPKNGSMRFFFYVLEAVDIAPYITGSAQPKLSQDNLGRIWLPVPPKKEQESIAKYLDAKCAKVDAILEIKRKQVEILKKRRQSLIYEYVTGKRRVGEES